MAVCVSSRSQTVGSWKDLARFSTIQVGSTSESAQISARKAWLPLLCENGIPILDLYGQYLVGQLTPPKNWVYLSVSTYSWSDGFHVRVECDVDSLGKMPTAIWERSALTRSRRLANLTELDFVRAFAIDWMRAHPKESRAPIPFPTSREMIRIEPGVGIGLFRLGGSYDRICSLIGVSGSHFAGKSKSVSTWTSRSPDGGQVDVWATLNGSGTKVIRYIAVTAPGFHLQNGVGPGCSMTAVLHHYPGAKVGQPLLPGVSLWEVPGKGLAVEGSDGVCVRISVYDAKLGLPQKILSLKKLTIGNRTQRLLWAPLPSG